MTASTQPSKSEPSDYPLIVDKDVTIPLRDGGVLYADVLRPDCDEPVPVIFNIGPYQKDRLWVPPPDLEEEPNEYMNWETVNPLWWCPRGYALLRVDQRGAGKSPGKSDPNSYQEAVDGYDCVEWAAQQDWCNGNVGMMGVSYHAAVQWRVASQQPPSLKAIIPWEGWADNYRDQAYHGGIFTYGFWLDWYGRNMAWHLLGSPQRTNPDAFNNSMFYDFMRNDLDSEWWRLQSAQWEKINIPVYSVGNWGGYSIHLRGNTEGFMRAASGNKKLRLHSGSHFHTFYAEEARLDQLRFMDYWLKGIDTGIMDEPPVKLAIRTGEAKTRYDFRFEDDWPIPRTQWTKLYLKPGEDIGSDAYEQVVDNAQLSGALSFEPFGEAGQVTYEASAPSRPGPAPKGISLISAPLDEETEITGPIVLNIWVSSTATDMDIFATLRNVDRAGVDVDEIGHQGQLLPFVSKGWLRASQRKLDDELSLPYRPYHAHDERWPLEPGIPVECQVEIWPSSMVFAKGHRIRLDITPVDGIDGRGQAGSIGTIHSHRHHHADYNWGAQHTVHGGGNMESYLLLPVIPPA